MLLSGRLVLLSPLTIEHAQRNVQTNAHIYVYTRLCCSIQDFMENKKLLVLFPMPDSSRNTGEPTLIPLNWEILNGSNES